MWKRDVRQEGKGSTESVKDSRLPYQITTKGKRRAKVNKDGDMAIISPSKGIIRNGRRPVRKINAGKSVGVI